MDAFKKYVAEQVQTSVHKIARYLEAERRFPEHDDIEVMKTTDLVTTLRVRNNTGGGPRYFVVTVKEQY